MNKALALLPFLILGGHLSADSVEPIVFPADAGVLDVRSFGGNPNDRKDDTGAIQAALDAHPNDNRIVYLAPGEWIVSDTLRWPQGAHHGQREKRTILQGSGRNRTLLKLPAETPGFQDSEEPQSLVYTGKSPAQRFRNAVRDLTVEVGPENPGAIALRFNASNQGTVSNVTLRDAGNSALIGLDLGFTSEIGPILVKNLIVEGFDIGIRSFWQVNSNTFENIRISGQRRYGWWIYHQMVFARNLISENSVPAVFIQKNSQASLSLIDSTLIGRDVPDGVPAIHNQRWLYLRNVDIRGYPIAVENDDKGRDQGDITETGLIEEASSHEGVHGLFRDIDDNTFATAGDVPHLPVKETPVVPWGDPGRDWVNVVDFGADPTGQSDSTDAFQAAIDSGARTVYLPGGATFRVTGEVAIRGPVQRIIGLEGRIFSEGTGTFRLVDDRHPGGLRDAGTVILERFQNRSGGPQIRIVHESDRTLVVGSCIGPRIEGRGTGDIFIEDVSGKLDLHEPGQSAWARQLNTEMNDTMLRNHGGNLWILGMKTEKIGTVIETTDGGTTDATGIFVYSNLGWNPGLPAFVIVDATAILSGLNERNFRGQRVDPWIRETRAGETRELAEMPWIYLSE